MTDSAMKRGRLLTASFLIGLLIAAIVNVVGILANLWVPADAWLVFAATVFASIVSMPLYERMRVSPRLL
jgi:hypothetical protein